MLKIVLIIICAFFVISCERDLTGPSFDVLYYGYECGTCEGEYFAIANRVLFNKRSSVMRVARIHFIEGVVDTLTVDYYPYNRKHSFLVVAGCAGKRWNDYNTYFDEMSVLFDEKKLVWYMNGKEYRTEEMVFFGDLEDI